MFAPASVAASFVCRSLVFQSHPLVRSSSRRFLATAARDAVTPRLSAKLAGGSPRTNQTSLASPLTTQRAASTLAGAQTSGTAATATDAAAASASPLFAHLILMLKYHRWAHALLLRSVAPLSDAQYRSDCGLAFRSVHGTLVHLQAAEQLWLQRMQTGALAGVEHLWGEGVTGQQLEQHIHSREEVAEKLITGAESLSALLAGTPASELEGSFSYKNTRGKAMQAQRSFILLHVVNHATHHRGQISAALTQLGQPAPALDLLYMLNDKA